MAKDNINGVVSQADFQKATNLSRMQVIVCFLE